MMEIGNDIDFDTAYKAWIQNQAFIGKRKQCDNSFAMGNLNALKVSEEQIKWIIDKMKAGEKITRIYEEYFQDICTLAAIRARVLKYKKKYGAD